MAGELQAKLENRGYKVFLDVDSIGSGDFPVQIDEAIKSCTDFLIVFSPGMLDRCVEEDDWVRHEIIQAEQYGKNIVGVALPGFVMPEPSDLPEPLRKLPEKQVFIWSHEYRNASINKISENLVAMKRKKKRFRRNITLIVGSLVILALGAVVMAKSFVPVDPMEEQKRAQLLEMKALNDTFASLVDRGDSLLREVVNPSEKQEYMTFMEGVNAYAEALDYQKLHPDVIEEDEALSQKYDSLMELRREWMNGELKAATRFLDVEQFDFARYRLENAKALSVDGEQTLFDVVELNLQNRS